MSLPIGTIIKIAQNILLFDTQTAINVFWASIDDNAGGGPLDEDDVVDAVANYLDLIYTDVLPSIDASIAGTLGEVWTVDVPTGDLTPIGDGATTWVGSGVGDAFPNGVAAIVTMKTTNTDVTGRKFIPGYVETEGVDNDLTGPALVRLANFGLDWAAQHIDANDVILNPGVYSGTKAAFFFNTGVIVANAILGYQRRRKPGVGT